MNSLKSQLDNTTTASAAVADAEEIISGYRVYALVFPQVELVKAADDQQVTEGKLSTMAQKLQARITAEQNAGKNVTSLQSELTSMNSQISAAQSISSNIETSVVVLQPSDYDTNHNVLSGDSAQLKTARSDEQGSI